ncbi:hypothetical protein [Microbacterium sp. SORGH_AS_0862]|uniref:hypothetical protein n=1 Tax=Microbacterium sp. SORGH_AS_0862 TaxID=3041789 RepID=UPI00278DF35A|nr:hypothetical protein [Microbacterium sp. SORGH_AS_0862]MDQ1204630.1 hypothetical protein [Microbacterium sp. SORGH_AS_0862]
MGTDAWRNWRDFDAREPESENVDEDLYSDRHFTGSSPSLGPYSLSLVFGDVSEQHQVGVRLALKLHMAIHTDLLPQLLTDGELVPANSDSYHGGQMSDEIVALISLHLGVRIRSAGTSRFSGRHLANPKAKPFYVEVPSPTTPGKRGREYIPATQTRQPDISDLARLHSFPRFAEADQIALVRAARAYAQGLWWSNEDPNLAWLQFVTAIEIAANHSQKVKAPSEALIRELWPELWAALDGADERVRARVCKQAAPQARSTRKFIDFISAYAPQPPQHRPAHEQLAWDRMDEHARLVYRHRSRALHDGKPFPLPMLELPRTVEDGSVQEVPLGLNAGGLGGVWDASETPMLLATFEHIARGALVRWWDALSTSDTATPS